jgi:hypothetical protein
MSCCSSTGRKQRLPSATTPSPVLDALEARVGTVSGRDVAERLRDRSGAELARGHCPHDSTYRNRESTVATSTMHAVSSHCPEDG